MKNGYIIKLTEAKKVFTFYEIIGQDISCATHVNEKFECASDGSCLCIHSTVDLGNSPCHSMCPKEFVFWGRNLSRIQKIRSHLKQIILLYEYQNS